ncbi:hypothetical protein, partial [Arthrobacter sp. ISL-95]|uniref:hypothetical protein n=1 Tax=Arthrobacter sp. ISL-95 TaxID=2819116 RepID=UPI001BE9F094
MMNNSKLAATVLELVGLDHSGMSSEANLLDESQMPGRDIADIELSENDIASGYQLTSESLPQEGVPA